jgi:serine/threonine protein kinase
VCTQNGHIRLVDFGFALQITDKVCRCVVVVSQRYARSGLLCVRHERVHGAGDGAGCWAFVRRRLVRAVCVYLSHRVFVCTQTHVRAPRRWSLGVLLFEMLLARTPFAASDRYTTFQRVLTGALCAVYVSLVTRCDRRVHVRHTPPPHRVSHVPLVFPFAHSFVVRQGAAAKGPVSGGSGLACARALCRVFECVCLCACASHAVSHRSTVRLGSRGGATAVKNDPL